MTKRTIGILFLLIAFAAALLAAGSKYTVTATMYNFDTNNNPFTLQSDGSSSAMYSSGSGGVASELTPNAGSNNYYQWFLDLTNSSRSYYVTLTPVNGSGPGPFSGALPFNGQLVSRCFGANASILQNWTQIQFSDPNCGMRATFTYQGVTYVLVMSPDYLGTGTATVTCTNWSTKSKSCSAWTDVPTPDIANANVANLYGSGGALVGQYSLSFNVVLTHP